MFAKLPEGWMSDEELTELQRLAAGKRVLEIGTWKGRSACAMALAGAEVFCLDTFTGDSSTGFEWTFPTVVRAGQDLGVIERLHFLMGTWQAILPCLDLASFDLLFYDADHSEDATFEAGYALVRGAREDVPVLFHDYLGWESVMKGVNHVRDLSARDLRIVGTIAALEWPPEIASRGRSTSTAAESRVPVPAGNSA